MRAKITAGSAYTDPRLRAWGRAGEPLQGTVVFKYHWLPTLMRLKLPRVRIHDLRHSAATLWLEAGLPLKLVRNSWGMRA
jgi:integrase